MTLCRLETCILCQIFSVYSVKDFICSRNFHLNWSIYFPFKYAPAPKIPIKMSCLNLREHQFQKTKPDKTVKLILDGYLRPPLKNNATESETPWVICRYLVSVSPSTVVMLNDSQKWVLPTRPQGQLAALLHDILMNNIYCQANTVDRWCLWKNSIYSLGICFDPPRWSRSKYKHNWESTLPQL